LSDAPYIEFDFTPIKNTISFRYFLASEEYEYNKNFPCQFSDAFAFLIKDVTLGGAYNNIALIPNTSIPVEISSIHPNLSSISGGCPASYATYFNGYNQNPPNIDGTNFNGSTKPLLASSIVIPGHTYHIKLVIADYGNTAANHVYDSAVFLEAGSFDLAGYLNDQNGTLLTGSAISCSSNPLILAAVSQVLNPTYQWYKDGVAIPAPLGTSPTFQIPIGGSGVYKVVVIDSVTNCVDSIATQLNVTVIDAPTAISPQSLCSGATVSSLAAIGSNIKWYSTLTGGSSLASTSVLTAGNYYASQTIGGCETTRALVAVVLNNTITSFTQIAPICAGATLSALPTTSNNSVVGTWLPALNNTTTTTYTFTPNSGQCGSIVTMTITVNPKTTPTFAQVTAICSGATLSALPITSNNAVTGTWLPALNNTATTTYTFTPLDVVCNNTASMTINVIQNTTPTFTQVAPICSGATLSTLPTTSNNSIIGTWTPALNNATTTTYTFTPTPLVGLCAVNSTMTILVNTNVNPTFTPINSICSGSTTIPNLPLVSLEGISGTWVPNVIDNLTSNQYVFTPNAAGQCSTNFTMSIVVQNPLVFKVFGSCNSNKYMLEIQPSNGLDLTNSQIHWQYNNADVATNASIFNVSDYYHSLTQASNLPITFTVNVANGGCSNNVDYIVTDLYCDIQKGISPNEDAKNDFFDLINFDVKELSIFNRYGLKVYSKSNYKKEWHGQSDSGSDLPDGTYFYAIEFNNNSQTKTGWIYINR
jgi:gliding motility-associated-like protein